jgi:hypothetical protein
MVAMSGGIAHGMRVLAWQIRIGWKALCGSQRGRNVEPIATKKYITPMTTG